MTGEPHQTEATAQPNPRTSGPLELKAITVRPPWSWAISHGPKRIENRGWTREWRGQLAIHAGKGWDRDGLRSPLVQQAWRDARLDLYALLDKSTPRLATGAIVAVADLVDICTVQGGYTDCHCGEWAVPFQCHWRLANVRPLPEPVPCRGFQQLWTPAPELAVEVLTQLPEQAGGGAR